MVGAGTSASVAYEKAKNQWFAKKQGKEVEAVGDAKEAAPPLPNQPSRPTSQAGKPQAYEGT